MNYLIVLCVLVAALLGVSVESAQAVYTEAIIQTKEKVDGLWKVTVRFVGNANETEVVLPRVIVPKTTAQDTYHALQEWAKGIITMLNISEQAESAAALAPGAAVPLRDPSPPTQSPCAVWRNKVHLYDQLVGKSYAGALGTAITTLKSNIESTFQASCLTE